ncbi:MAG TPA: ABC transporter ATP-binding protein [Candidatus Dormibacteraeota bacterium]|nr:ABC transporter ATP-binding protein [Candidatus Dormibacteraeota bacterium]
MPTVISVDGLRKRYSGVPVVDGVSFEVNAGEIFGVLGPNGAGKTTTVECLQGLREGDEGEVRVLGLDPWRESPQLRRRIGSQLQESSLPERIRVGEALSFFARPGSDWRHLLEDWGLADKRNTAFANLSGGQRQRLFVALALVNNPEVVFLDEMTTGLDPGARRVAWDLIEEIRRRGTTVVLVTHFMEEAERLCDRVAVINRGKVVAMGRPRELIAAHAGEVHVHFTVHQPVPWLKDVPFVHSLHQDDGSVEVLGEGAVLAHVGAALVAHGCAPEDLHVERMTLEDVFLRITGRQRETD